MNRPNRSPNSSEHNPQNGAFSSQQSQAADAPAPRPVGAAIKAVLFDLDDTLWPIVPVIVAAEKTLFEWLQQHAPAVAAAHSIESLRDRRQALIDADARHRIDHTALRTVVMHEAFEACGEDPGKIAAGIALFRAARNRVQPFDDVLPALRRLSENVILGSISNGAADLEVIGMAQHFRISVAAHAFGSTKPDPAIFRHACEALGVAPSEAVYVGDDPEADIVGAQQAGMRAVWINRFDRTLPAHIRPDAVCNNLEQLETWLSTVKTMQGAQGA
jgi:HAD superfamily hydrolase (TIGR01509 family)